MATTRSTTAMNKLLEAIASSEVHTVVLVFPDMQGRWMGKRLTGRHFAEVVHGHGTHACAYLLTVDMEMDPVPGYALTSWERGYQDFLLAPDERTLRPLTWSPGSVLLVCDVLDDARKPIDVARDSFHKTFFTACPSMVDYLHLELVRTLANDNPELLGCDYPGPIV